MFFVHSVFIDTPICLSLPAAAVHLRDLHSCQDIQFYSPRPQQCWMGAAIRCYATKSSRPGSVSRQLGARASLLVAMTCCLLRGDTHGRPAWHASAILPDSRHLSMPRLAGRPRQPLQTSPRSMGMLKSLLHRLPTRALQVSRPSLPACLQHVWCIGMRKQAHRFLHEGSRCLVLLPF